MKMNIYILYTVGIYSHRNKVRNSTEMLKMTRDFVLYN